MDSAWQEAMVLRALRKGHVWRFVFIIENSPSSCCGMCINKITATKRHFKGSLLHSHMRWLTFPTALRFGCVERSELLSVYQTTRTDRSLFTESSHMYF